MKHSKKYIRKIKKRILGCTISIIISLMLIAGSRLTELSMPLSNSSLKKFSAELEVDSNGIKLMNAINNERTKNKLNDTDKITYIYDAEDLIKFRDSVNLGNSYTGKKVYLMSDIDLSTVCSETLGSWIPIGNENTAFKGTFNGNYYRINNLYINSTEDYQALFGKASNAVIKNIILNNAKVTGNDYVAGILAYGEKVTISRCGIDKDTNNNEAGINGTETWGGGIISYGNNITVSECYNKINITIGNPNSIYTHAGGILGEGRNITISSCYNTGNITATGLSSNYGVQGTRAGGIVGTMETNNIVGYCYNEIENCYNEGDITSSGACAESGGIAGCSTGKTINKSFNVGEINATNYVHNRGGNIVGIGINTIVNDCYYVKNNICGYNSGNSYNNNKLETIENIKDTATDIMNGYSNDTWKNYENENEGYPILKWQSLAIELEERQEYIKIGENLKLDIIQIQNADIELRERIEENVSSACVWKSSNEDVATVDSNGLVTGIGIGQTTITAYNEASNVKRKAIINVYRNTQGAITVPQVALGEGFTVVLKEDGTVWSTGKNDCGQLGDGTTTNRNTLEQVKIDENTYLINVKKIAVGENHSVALTLDGKVYAWGYNDGLNAGSLGQGDSTNRVYATRIKGINGEGQLENIIDIEAGYYETYALDKEGQVYACGYNIHRQISDINVNSISYMTKVTSMKNVIEVSSAGAMTATISAKGETWIKGNNSYGAFGNGTTAQNGLPYLIGTDINEIELMEYAGAILKEDGTLWTTGYNNYGQLGLGDTDNRTTYTEVKYENGEIVKAKTISTGSQNLQFIGENGKVYVTGNNEYGQLSNGNTTNATYPMVMKNEDETEVTDSSLLASGGKCRHMNNTHNMALIREDGTVWISGDNTYGQIGNGTNESTNYLTMVGKYIEISLNKRNEYIRIGKTLDLDISVGTSDFNVLVGKNQDLPSEDINFNWTSSNEDIATVDSNGIVTGIGIGCTTITAYNPENGLKAKAIINVYRNTEGAVTVPQVALGEGFTIVLKEDGTVWATGKNDGGQLGDGTTNNRNTLEQVKIDENTYLGNVKKISVGYGHVIALTLNGEVYGWGYNGAKSNISIGSENSGILGQGDRENKLYAARVKGEEGVGYLENIIDIACGDTITYALNNEGIVFGCGANYWYQITDSTRDNLLYPTQVTGIKDAIKLTSGYSKLGVILSNGQVFVKGNNEYGVFGNGTISGIGGQYLVGTDINEFELSGYFGAILKEDGTLWTTGRNEYGQLGLGDTSNRTTYTQVKYEDDNVVKAKTISLGDQNLQFIGEDGRVYVTGYNGYGQLCDGTTQNSTYPKVLKYEDGTEVTDAIYIASGTNPYNTLSRNIGLIRKDGSVWLSGDNTYGQIGNGTNTSTKYLTSMSLTTMPYLEKIDMQVGETRTLTEQELTIIKEYVNVFGKGKEESTLVEKAEILNTNIATYENGIIEALAVGSTTLKLEEEKGLIFNIPVTVVSDDAAIELVEVNDILRNPTKEDKNIYEAGIPKLSETAKIRVKARSKYGIVKIGENTGTASEQTVTVNLSLSEERITIPVEIAASDGVTVENYSIILIRQSEEAGLNKVVVNGVEIENRNNIYTYYLQQGEKNANIEITAIDNNANIIVEEKTGTGYLEISQQIENGIKTVKTIKVVSEDGTVTKEYTLIILTRMQIMGQITTENLEGKYTATVKLYKKRRKEDGNGYEEEDTLITEKETTEDGKYVLDIDEIGIYDVLITKAGYLNYKIAEIEIKEGAIVEIQEYALIAGDVAVDGEIEIDDLVDMNRNIGKEITEENKEEKAIYDLNEDGKIDMEDRKILKKNYGKKAETEKWIDTNEEIAMMSLDIDENTNANAVGAPFGGIPVRDDTTVPDETVFILPMSCKYTITSTYGKRVHPITGEEKLHSGIDLVGEHHTEILSVLGGTVTYAGEQNGYGNCIEIKHIVNGETIYSFYAHLSEIKIKAGEKVKKGQVIGLEGGAETDEGHGTSTGHHLHFEIRTASGGGHSVDPTKYINF